MRRHESISGFCLATTIVLLATLTLACNKPADGEEDGHPTKDGGQQAGQRTGGSRGGDGSGGGAPGGGNAIPVEVASAERKSISSYIQSNGTLEAENEVDIVARTTGPIVELRTEEGRHVGKGELLARIEDDEVRSQLEISRANLEEARSNYERAERLNSNQLISSEEYDRARTQFETERAQYEGNKLLVDYTEIRAPFAGQIVVRYVDRAEQVTPGTRLFRISDFDPLLCPVQVPERELRKLAVDQSAYLKVEAWPDERFSAKVLRLSPVVDAATGTIKVTLDVDGAGQLRPGMFARVFLETDTHDNAIVIPKAALSLESLGDTVFTLAGETAERRDIELGFEEGDSVEVLRGVEPGEQVIVVGQDGLSDGTPVQVLGGGHNNMRGAHAETEEPRPRPDRPGRPDPADMSPEQLERAREAMRARGLTDEEIEERLGRRRRQGSGSEESAEGSGSTGS